MAPKKSKRHGSPKKVALSRLPLVPSCVHIRIRPLASEGVHAQGEPCNERLKTWTDHSVTMDTHSQGLVEFNYPASVCGPNTSQVVAYDAMLPDLVFSFTEDATDVVFFAYGQSGTGKTHTMLGTPESLESGAFHADWGIFPRVVHQVFQHIEEYRGRRTCAVSASAIEFYAFQCFDLLNSHLPVEIAPGHWKPLGQSMRPLQSIADLMTFLADVKHNRATQSTPMNLRSSRSHCAMILTLGQVDNSTGEYVQSSFHLVNLAGSERSSKTGEAHCTVMDAMIAVQKGNELPIGATGVIINFDLFGLSGEVLKATEMHKRRTPYAPPRCLTTEFIKYACACLMGEARLGMVICLSQALQNGSETFFSLKYGRDLAQLRAPVQKQRALPIDKAVRLSVRAAKNAAKDLANSNESNKFYTRRQAVMRHTADLRDFVGQFVARDSEDSNETKDVIVAVFKQFDANGDGMIDCEEMAAVLHRLNPKEFTSERSAVLFKMADLNRDDRICVEEFITWIANHSGSSGNIACTSGGTIAGGPAAGGSSDDEFDYDDVPALIMTRMSSDGAQVEDGWKGAPHDALEREVTEAMSGGMERYSTVASGDGTSP
eukprot:TRINITY_DN74546_c0_g1_i1.p1 TRINITY_DN74546_c0_g1~~TRINITY_DN74546_c0_g1_i1.p1  ORF type:complete len:602 (-),score=95.52 TRINITY_DN74546_c0_g1_i1:54-1859(-)